MADKEFEKFFLNIFVTSAASVVAKTVTAPIERIKLILQNQDSQVQIIRGERQKYNGFINCFLRIPKEQGFLSFWRGNGTNLIRYVPGQVLNFSFNDLFKCYLHNNISSMFLGFVSGACAGAVSILAVYPLKYCQTRLTVDTGSLKSSVPREFCGFTDCFAKVVRAHGFLGVYKGFSVALAGSILHRALYFGLFDSMNQTYALYLDVRKVPLGVKFFIAQVATNAAGLATYPFDTIGRRLMVETGVPENLRSLHRPWNATKVIYNKEGFSSFYKGALTNSLKGICGALVLVLYEEVIYYVYRDGDEFMPNRNDLEKFMLNFMVAGCTGAIAKTITAPMDRIKLILQTQNSAIQVLEGKRKPYTGIINCLKRIPKEQGVLSFWRGNMVNVLRYVPTQALNFSLNDHISKALRDRVNPQNMKYTNFVSGGISGAVTLLVMYPLEYCQTRISADIGSDRKEVNDKYYVKREFKGVHDCIYKTSRRGYKGFYCGLGPATLGMTMYRTLYFGLYDYGKRKIICAHEHSDKKIKFSILTGLAIAQFIIMLSSTISYPFDTLGRRMMLEVAKSNDKRRFHNTLGAAKLMYTEEGIRSFYKGIFANYLKGFSGALILVLYDEITSHFNS